MRVLSFFNEKRARARLIRDTEIFSADFDCIRALNVAFSTSPHALAVEKHLSCVRQFLEVNDIEGGWGSLHAAGRSVVPGFTSQQLAARIYSLLAESSKLTSWRAGAIHSLLKTPDVTSVQEAMRLRDDSSANLYHKIWLTSDQLNFLLWTCAICLLCLAPLAVFAYLHPSWATPDDVTKTIAPPTWSFTMLLTVIAIGVCGGSFSVAQSLFSQLAISTIPERVVNHWTTLIRSLFGGIAGLAGYAFSHTGLFRLDPAHTDPIALALSVSFAFGYTGERMIARIIDSIGSEKK
jgi:hypothetical protein